MGIGHSVSWLDWSITIFGILSLLDMVLRCLCYNYIFLSGLLVISTMTNIKIKLISVLRSGCVKIIYFLSGLLVISTMTNIKIKLVDGKSFSFSSRIITYVKIFPLKTPIRDAHVLPLQRINELVRVSYKMYEYSNCLLVEFDHFPSETVEFKLKGLESQEHDPLLQVFKM